MGQEEPVSDNQPVAVAVAAPPGSIVSAPPGSAKVAIPDGNAAVGVPMWQQAKQGAKCCGCCCDYRRAVIILAVINLVISIIYIILVITAASIPGVEINIDDDAAVEIYEDSLRMQSILYGITILASLCALFGAMKYNIVLVGVNVLWYIVSFILGTIATIGATDDIEAMVDDAIDFNYSPIPSIAISAAVTALFMYPHIGFISEVRKGIMTQETYPREEYSCCCVTKRGY